MKRKKDMRETVLLRDACLHLNCSVEKMRQIVRSEEGMGYKDGRWHVFVDELERYKERKSKETYLALRFKQHRKEQLSRGLRNMK